MQWATKQKGFTIVEILIVIVVIAILVTITVVAYTGVTQRAKALAITNSLNNATDAVKLDTLNGTAPSTLPSSVKPDKDIVISMTKPTGDASEFCINAYRISAFEVGSFDSESGQIRDYLCPGIVTGSPAGGSIPAVPLSKNLIALDFADWELTGSVTYDASTKELTFSGASGQAKSPWVRMAGSSTSTRFTYELFSTGSSVTFSPNAGVYSGSAYYAADGTTPATSSAGYTTNGNAQSVPLNAWTSRTWVVTTGPNVQYVRYNINLAPATYTSNNFKVRNPSIERNG